MAERSPVLSRFEFSRATTVLTGGIDQISLDDFDWLMNVNFRAVVR